MKRFKEKCRYEENDTQAKFSILLGNVFRGLQCVSSNSKFCSFLVWILIQKDNTDNKVFKKEFYTKETRKNGIEKIECCKF